MMKINSGIFRNSSIETLKNSSFIQELKTMTKMGANYLEEHLSSVCMSCHHLQEMS